ncbi:MAG: cytochrome c [Bryobacteraceae bacterium]
MIARVAAIFAAGSCFLASTSAAPTFHKEIEPILQQRCQSCHRPGEPGPMPLLTYAQTRPWAKAIKSALLGGKMPPWSPDKRYGKFTNDLSMPAAEREALVAWVDAGSPEGSAADAPAAKQFTEGWKIPKPDVVFELPEEMPIPSSGVLGYQYIPVPTGFTEDKWVQMLEVRPTEPSVVHHAIVTVDSGRGGMGAQNYLAGYAPGMLPQLWKPGTARLIKAGSTLIFQMHYTTNGKAAKDRTRLGLVFAKAPVTEQVIASAVSSYWLEIPPQDPNYRTDAALVMRETVKLVGMRAHMHLRGKSFEFRAVYPSGEKEVLLSIPKYDFNWQPYYYLATPKILPRGTRIECTGVFDNSKNNPFNPDPKMTVGWGPQSWDEMMIGWLDLAVDPQSTTARMANRVIE